MDIKHENMDYVSPASSLKSPKSVSVSKQVLLTDWWLIKVKNSEGVNKLGLGGMAWTGTKVSRVFSSAPVIKRHNAWNLETADGVMVKIEGIINQSRTYQNGFSCKVCGTFMAGFPYNWEADADWWFAKDDTCESALELNLADVPVNKVFDYLAFSHGCLDHVENGQQSKDKLSDKVGQEKGSLECTPKVPGNPATRCMGEQFLLNSVGSLSLNKSRSGRLLVPNQAIWLNQKVVYDQVDRSSSLPFPPSLSRCVRAIITTMQGGVPERESDYMGPRIRMGVLLELNRVAQKLLQGLKQHLSTEKGKHDCKCGVR